MTIYQRKLKIEYRDLKLYGAIKELEDLDVMIKSIDGRLLDFPAEDFIMKSGYVGKEVSKRSDFSMAEVRVLAAGNRFTLKIASK